ncbi:MAG: methyl-accepting chemotaxis protein [Treponema sp.]|nr:methyl-accepting chemotaxis protein [Treponema sp.]
MPGKNLKITTKLTICAAVFLLPLGIMLFSIISVSLASIQKGREELKGMAVLQPAVLLMQIVPQYIRFYFDNVSGDKEHTDQYIENLIVELEDRYWAHFGRENAVAVPQFFSETNQTLEVYTQFVTDLCQLIAYIGDISGLVTDSELRNAYLVAAVIHDMPQTQERMVIISNLLRSIGNSALNREQRDELERHLGILVYSDNVRIQNRFNSLEALNKRDAHSETPAIFSYLLKNCYNAVAFFGNAVEYVLNEPVVEMQEVVALGELAGRANDAAYRLQEAALEHLKMLINSKIRSNQQRFTLSLVFALGAALAAFAITIVTIIHIRSSTQAINRVFSSLEKNDLSIQIEVLSRDELGELIMDLGDFLAKLQSAFNLFRQNASIVSTAVHDLSASAKEITATANEQSSSVAKIVSTMENNKTLSGQVAAKTLEVAELAAQTENLSQHGASLHNANEDMMADIRDQNAKIIDEIRNLTDVLSRIDESVQLIDTFADRTKLIAFNAALEASSSGEAGLRFAVVAAEIRRFADNVVESVTEIKERIVELQNVSGALISEANIGTRAIDSGYNRMVEQKKVFSNIVNVSQNVAVRSQQISGLSKQQELAVAQVFLALKEISTGVKQFVIATASTSATADNLNKISGELKNTLEKYRTAKHGGSHDNERN